jgi:NAD-dependent deacetylase
MPTNQIKQLAALIGASDNTVFFGGAGVSTESGIPDFRSEDGLYAARESYGHPPEELLSHGMFQRRPELFFRYYKENLITVDAQPNAAHLALAALEQAGKLQAVITQNVDGLHQAAGSVNVLELHGSNWRQYCQACGARHTLEYVLAQDGVPRCRGCGGIVRPDVVLYQEALDEGLLAAAVRAIAAAELLIVAGTSLVVYPAAGLLRYFSGDSLVLINKSVTAADQDAQLAIHDAVGSVLQQALSLCFADGSSAC